MIYIQMTIVHSIWRQFRIFNTEWKTAVKFETVIILECVSKIP